MYKNIDINYAHHFLQHEMPDHWGAIQENHVGDPFKRGVAEEPIHWGTSKENTFNIIGSHALASWLRQCRSTLQALIAPLKDKKKKIDKKHG